jgi:hypothetical protein
MTTISDRQRQAIVGALLEAAQRVNAGGHPGEAIRAMLATIKGVAGHEAQEAPAGAPGLALVHTPASPAPIPVSEAPEPVNGPTRRAEAAMVQRVFAYWVKAAGKGTQAKLTRDRQQKILARAREGYTEQDMLRAIDGICASSYHRGENDSGTQYLDLTLVFRNGSKLEHFRDMAPDKMTRTVTSDPRADELAVKIDRLRQERDRALKEGRTDDYQLHVRSLRAAEKELAGISRAQV